MNSLIWSVVGTFLAFVPVSESFCPSSSSSFSLISKQHSAIHKPLFGPGPPSRTALRASVSSYDDNLSAEAGKLKVTRKKSNKQRTLYDLLDANPKDSQAVLKQRYTALVRRLHPDARVGHDLSSLSSEALSSELSEVNAAWQILSDPKERLKYDRELKAKEFADGLESGVGSLVEFGFKTAMPWLKKTADTTVAVVDQSAAEARKAVDQSAAEAKKAYSVFEKGQSVKQLEKKAAAELLQAAKLKNEIAKRTSTKAATLKDPTIKLTGTEATKLLKRFDVTDFLPAVKNDIKSLVETERRHKEIFQNRVNAEKATQLAEKQVDLTMKAEELALAKLEEAQKALAEAQANNQAAQKARQDALKREKTMTLDFDRAEMSVEKIKEKVRTGLLKHEMKFMEREAQNLKNEVGRLENSAKALQREADQKKGDAKKLRA